MASSRGRLILRNVVVPMAASLAAVLLVAGLGWAALHSFLGPKVQRIDPAVLPELRADGAHHRPGVNI